MTGVVAFVLDKLLKLGLLTLVGVGLLGLNGSFDTGDWGATAAVREATIGVDDPAIVVVFRPSATAAQIAELYRRHDLARVKRLPELGKAERVTAPLGRHATVIAALRAEPIVRLVEEDTIVSVPRPVPGAKPAAPLAWSEDVFTPKATPNDQFFRTQWGPGKINLPAAWDITTGRPEIKVAVIDSGFYGPHPDRPKNLTFGPDFSESGGSDKDGSGHGTHVAGTVAASFNNSLGVAGVAPDVSVAIIRTLNDEGRGRVADTARGLRWAADNGFRVVNMSLGGPNRTDVVKEAVDYAYSKGVVLVAAAGNCGNGCPEGPPNYVSYPAAFDHVLAVGASTDQDTIARFSTHQPYVGISGPGQDISSLYAPNAAGASPDRCEPTTLQYCFLSGTSMASPHVAGVAALVLSINPQLTPDQVMDMLKQSAVDLRVGADFQGRGRVDALAAVRAAQATIGKPSPTVTVVPSPSATPTVGGGTPPRGNPAAFVPIVRQDFNDANLGGVWVTGLQVANLDTAQTANVTLQLVESGGRVVTEQSTTIGPTKSTTFFGPSLGAPAGFNGAAVVYSDRPIGLIANQLTSNPGAADSFNGVAAPATTVHVPRLRRNAAAAGATAPTRSSLYVQNAGTAPATNVRVSFYRLSETPVTTATLPTIPPGASAELSLQSLSGLPDGFSGTAIVTADQPVAVAVNFVDGRTLVSFTSGAPGDTLNAPLVMYRNSGFSTETFIQNAGTRAAMVDAFGVDSRTGQRIQWDRLTLMPGTGRILVIGGDETFVGSVTVTSSGAPLVGVAMQANQERGQASGYTLFTKGSERVVAPLVQTSNSGWQTGFQVQNIGTTTANVRVAVTDASGSSVSSVPNPSRSLAAGKSETWFPISAIGVRVVGASEVTGPPGSQLIGVVNQLNQTVSGDQFTTYSALGVDNQMIVPTPMPQPSGTPFPSPVAATPTPGGSSPQFTIFGCSDARSQPGVGTEVGFAGIFRRVDGSPVPNARLLVGLNYAGTGLGFHAGPPTDRDGFSGGFLELESQLAQNTFVIAFEYLGARHVKTFTFGASDAVCPTLTPSGVEGLRTSADTYHAATNIMPTTIMPPTLPAVLPMYRPLRP
ncbi:MAG: S8 family serine peptidase [Chloroflexi bacterium]|nr:S8 family serine peptidase [Chloroflexota bacterium]